jgi:hypothetical protein
MNTPQHTALVSHTARVAKYIDGPVAIDGDIVLRQRFFSYETDVGLVTGADINVMFTIDRSAREIWPHFKDFDRWQNANSYFYTGVVGDLYSSPERNLGTQRFRIGTKPNDPSSFYPFEYQVLMVVPERLIVIFQPIPEDGSNGGISPGFHVFALNEHSGKTVVTMQMEHATRTRGLTEEQALEPWRKEHASEVESFVRGIFIPTLRRLVYEGKKA